MKNMFRADTTGNSSKWKNKKPQLHSQNQETIKDNSFAVTVQFNNLKSNKAKKSFNTTKFIIQSNTKQNVKFPTRSRESVEKFVENQRPINNGPNNVKNDKRQKRKDKRRKTKLFRSDNNFYGDWFKQSSYCVSKNSTVTPSPLNYFDNFDSEKSFCENNRLKRKRYDETEHNVKKTKYSDTTNKTKYNDQVRSYNSESSRIDEERDTDLFYFDVSGNRKTSNDNPTKINLEHLDNKKQVYAKKQKRRKKSNINVETSTYCNDNDFEENTHLKRLKNIVNISPENTDSNVLPKIKKKEFRIPSNKKKIDSLIYISESECEVIDFDSSLSKKMKMRKTGDSVEINICEGGKAHDTDVSINSLNRECNENPNKYDVPKKKKRHRIFNNDETVDGSKSCIHSYISDYSIQSSNKSDVDVSNLKLKKHKSAKNETADGNSVRSFNNPERNIDKTKLEKVKQSFKNQYQNDSDPNDDDSVIPSDNCCIKDENIFKNYKITNTKLTSEKNEISLKNIQDSGNDNNGEPSANSKKKKKCFINTHQNSVNNITVDVSLVPAETYVSNGKTDQFASKVNLNTTYEAGDDYEENVGNDNPIDTVNPKKQEMEIQSTLESKSHKYKDENVEISEKQGKAKRRKISIFAEYMQTVEKVEPSENHSYVEKLEINPEHQEEDIKNFKKLTGVLLPFSVAPLHAIATRSSPLTKEQLEKAKNLNISIKTGPFSKAEDNKIIENWMQFCKEYNLRLNPLPFVKFSRKLNKDTKMNFLRYLGRDLDDRYLHRIYIRFKLLLQKHNLKTGRFTSEEDKIILDFMETTTSTCPFRDLSGLLGRTRSSIEMRYDRLTSDNKKHYWTLEKIEKFIKTLMKITKCVKVKDLKTKQFKSKHWRKLSKKLDNIEVKKLKRAWTVTIYPRLFSKEVDLREIKHQIIYILCERNETDWRAVNWKEIATNFKGFSSNKIYMMFKQFVYFNVPKQKHDNLKECLDFLKSGVLIHYKIPSTHTFRKIVFKNDRICYDTVRSS